MALRGYALFADAHARFSYHSALIDGSLVIEDMEGAKNDLEHLARALDDSWRSFHDIPAGDDITLNEDLTMRGIYARLEKRITHEKPL